MLFGASFFRSLSMDVMVIRFATLRFQALTFFCHTEAFRPSVSPWFVISSEGEAGVEKSILHFFQ